MTRFSLLPAFLAAATMAAELPVRQVTLYKHGIGYFERAGQLGPGESARLDFKASEMNDVLKSLTVEEKGGGKITGLRYDSSEPLAEKLAEFPFKLGDAQPLSAVLDQLKGARVELKLGPETVAGAIVSGRVVPASDKQPEHEQLTLMLDNSDLRGFDLGAVASLRFSDPTLQTQFKDYLATLINARSKEKRSVYIDSTDAKARQIIADYTIPTPIWKSSYRLIFDQAAQPTLEGWAIVDNTTGEDWNNIQLSLVSGRPISFVSRLYEPRYITRPTAELPEERAQAPVVHEGAIEDAEKAKLYRPSAGLAAPVVGGVPGAMAEVRQFDAGRLLAPRASVTSSISSTAATRELGELFEYRIPTPVTVKKNQSAMLPFLQQKIEARKLLIYADQSSAHPMNAAELTNSSGKTLDGGPITVYDGGAYGGEALMETLKAGDKRLISYGVDLGTRITTQFDSKGEIVREIHMRRGVLTSRVAAQETRTYTIRNVDQKAKTLIIEHPARYQYSLLDLKPWEKTANAYRFEVKLAPGATEKFPVAEERVFENSFALVNLTPDVLLTYIQNKNLSDAARKQLQQVADRKQQIADTNAEIRQAQSRISSLTQDQERIRQNINSLNQVSGQQQQVQSYARKLASQESELATLRDQVAALERKRGTLEAELNSLILKMEF